MGRYYGPVDRSRYEAGWEQITWRGERLFCVRSEWAERAEAEVMDVERTLESVDTDFSRGSFEEIVDAISQKFTPVSND